MATHDSVGAIASLSIVGVTSAFFTAHILSLEVARSQAVIAQTPLDRTSGGMTYAPGRLTSWTLSGTMIYDPKTQKAVPLGTKGQTVITWANATGTTLTWSTGFLTSVSVPVALEEGMEASFTLTVCGNAS
jgi:hypothetical protein